MEENSEGKLNERSNEGVWESILNNVDNLYIRELKIGWTRPVDEDDFNDQMDNIIDGLKNLLDLLCIAETSECYGFADLHKDLKSKIIINLLLLCGEHSCDKDAWATDVTISFSGQILKKLFKLCSCNSVEELLVNNISNKKSLIQLVFDILRPKLLKDTWKSYPAAVSSYVWVLTQIQMPHIGPVLHSVMPTALILIDDYVPSNRLLGLNCFHHITENVTTTELSCYCDFDSLYKTLEPMLYNLEPEIVEPLVKCLVSVISKKLCQKDKLKWTLYDDVMNILLPSVEMEQKLSFRSAYMKSLPLLIESMGLSCIRWSNRFYRIFEEYAAIPYDRAKCFKVMYSFIRTTWPRTQHQRLMIIILKSLLDLTYNDNETCSSENKDETLDAIRDCINILKEIAPDEMVALRSNIINHQGLGEEYKIFFSDLNF